MAVEWLRLWHDMPNDPKWRTIAKVSGQSIALVQSVYLHLLVDASRNSPRGHITLSVEDIASALDADDNAIAAIWEAMEGRVRQGSELTGWTRRQPKREDVGNPETGAKSAYARKRDERKRARDTVPPAESHALSRNVTTDKEKDTETEKDTEPLEPIGSTVTAAAQSDDVALAMRLFEELLQDMPSSKQPNFESWADDIRLMREVDGRTPKEITAAWRYARKHGHWRNQIRSPAKLRKLFGQLRARARATKRELMPKGWRPNPESFALLTGRGIPAAFLEDLVPEFELYWRERAEPSDNWDKVFRHHARTSWGRYKATEPIEMPKRMPSDWRPSEDAYSALREAGVDIAFANALLPEFVLYWSESRQTHAAWNAKFVNHVVHRWTHRNASGGKATRDLSLDEQLRDRSWAEGAARPPELRRVGLN